MNTPLTSRDGLDPGAQLNDAVELGQLLSKTVGSVAQAQEQLDAYTEARRAAYEEAPQGSLVLPPLWYVFSAVSIELELSATVVQGAAAPAQLMCRTLNPTSVGLYGHRASAGLRVRVQLEPQGLLPIKHTTSTP